MVPISIPPLRTHKQDIPYLVDHFIKRFAEGSGKTIEGITPEAMKLLVDFHWPGNVRELENIIERAVVMASGSRIEAGDIRLDVAAPGSQASSQAAGNPATMFLPEGMTLEEFEDKLIRKALQRAGGNKSQAARLLGLSRNALRYRLSKIGVPDEPES